MRARYIENSWLHVPVLFSIDRQTRQACLYKHNLTRSTARTKDHDESATLSPTRSVRSRPLETSVTPLCVPRAAVPYVVRHAWSSVYKIRLN